MNAINGKRPDPDELLTRLEQENAKAQRGRLKIFFGAAAGVGKTYAMLLAARERRAENIDIVAGLVETHGRKETAALLEGLETLPVRRIEYRGTTLHEFNLDAALKRKPSILLVDELAHSNAAGSRHPKRWQDIDELLDAGIDVYTTLNVQHLESLNDDIGHILGIKVWETVPDRIFEQADEAVLVDLPPDELLQRLKEGKVYIPEQAERAIQNFFRKGNLIALRDLALRRTAERVDGDMRTYRSALDIQTVWKTGDGLLACVGPKQGDEMVIRAAARLAGRLNSEWHAVYVETPRLQRLSKEQRNRILYSLKLAEELGAQTSTLSGQDIAETLAAYAHRHNLSKIILGRENRISWWDWWHEIYCRLINHAPDIDILQIARTPDTVKKNAGYWFETPKDKQGIKWQRYAWTLIACLSTTALCAPLRPIFDLANIVMLFLLTVVLVAWRFGRGPAVLAAFLNVAAFDVFFVPPRWTFAVHDVQYLLTFGVMLSVALIIGSLTSGLRYQAHVAEHRAFRAKALYEMARELSGALQIEQVMEIGNRHICSTFHAHTAILLANDEQKLHFPDKGNSALNPADLDLGIAQWVYDHGEAAGLNTNTLPGSSVLYLPLPGPTKLHGVLAIEPLIQRWLLIPEQRRQLDTFAALVAIALERVHYVDLAQTALVRVESERLRNSLLAVFSHDLRTPLTSLIGLVEAISLPNTSIDDAQQELMGAIHEEAMRMNSLVNNLLDMARLQSGQVHLQKQWHSLEEILGSALRALDSVLATHPVKISLPPDLPLIEFDAVLIERVLYNLIENAAKYTPTDTHIEISAKIRAKTAEVSVIDDGPGIPTGTENAIFEKFTRGNNGLPIPGFGLGLTICRTIIEAHGGSIAVRNLEPTGVCFSFTLPLGAPPEIEEPHLWNP